MRVKRKRLKRLCKRKWHKGYSAGREAAVRNHNCHECKRTFGTGPMEGFNGVLHCPFCQADCGMIASIARADIINDALWQLDNIGWAAG